MKKLFYIAVLVFGIMGFSVVCHAEDGLQIKITNGEYTEEITLTEEFYRKSVEIDYTQDITFEVVDKEKEVYFGHVVDNQESISDTKSETNIFTVTPSETSEEERIVIKTDEKEYSILYKYDFLLKNMYRISQNGFSNGSRYTILNYGLKTAFSDGIKTYKQGVDNSLDFTKFENEYLEEYDNVVYTGVYCLNEDGTVDTETLQADYPFRLLMRKPQPGGESIGTSYELGSKIRIYSISGDKPELIYTQSELGGTNFNIDTDRFGTYAIVYKEYAFDSQVYYSFAADSVTETDSVYTIKDLSGNGYDGTSTESSIATLSEFNVIDSICGTGKAVCGAVKIPNEAFANIDSSYTINFVGKYIWELRPIILLDFSDCFYTSAWGSGMIRHASYFENSEKVGFMGTSASCNEYNMYTFICDKGQIRMYINGIEVNGKYDDDIASVILSEIAQNTENEFIVQNYYLDEFRLYNRVLTNEEIKELWNNEIITEINDLSWIDNQLTANVRLNTFLSPFNHCIFAVYDENDNLIKAIAHEMTDGVYVGDLQMECSEKPAYLKLFIWDSVMGMKPQFNSAEYQIQ